MNKLLTESSKQYEILSSYLLPNSNVNFPKRGVPECPISNPSDAIVAHRNLFERLEWVKNYFEACHRDIAFKERWLAAGGSWDDKIVVDIGCGPGNLYANLGGAPKALIGVDISPSALKLAQQIGYTPLLADAHQLPFIDGFADLVALNATIHHCEDMAKVLTEASRLVRPGGILIADHDPQLSAWNYKGLALLMYKLRLPIYRLLLPNLHIPKEERLSMLETEIHHKPGDGVTAELFHQTLEPLGFSVKIYPHNQTVGAEALQGNYGTPPHWRYRLGQCLSGIDLNSPEAALSLLCVATRKAE